MTAPESLSAGATSPRAARAGPLLLPWAGIAGFFLIWWLLTDVLHPEGFLGRFALSRSLLALERLVLGGELWPHVAASLRRIVVGLAISVALGFPLGLAVGTLPRFGTASAPLFHFLRMVSPLSWTPLAIMLFGVGDTPVYFLIAMAGMWPIVLSTSAAVASFDRRLLLVGRSLGGSGIEVARTVVWPSIRPQVATGIRLSMGLGWVVLVPAEMLGVDSGLGYFALSTRDRLDYSELAATIIVTGLLGVAIDRVARWALS
ncbi:MAG TPA: ABC transporter permease [Polyangiaceae bacterium]|jgi:NitT/TauT family transport system permease protein|nr:ABC transporter permease [Polyangiaceae bacterium]